MGRCWMGRCRLGRSRLGRSRLGRSRLAGAGWAGEDYSMNRTEATDRTRPGASWDPKGRDERVESVRVNGSNGAPADGASHRRVGRPTQRVLLLVAILLVGGGSLLPECCAPPQCRPA